jgi:hypothetical protein
MSPPQPSVADRGVRQKSSDGALAERSEMPAGTARIAKSLSQSSRRNRQASFFPRDGMVKVDLAKMSHQTSFRGAFVSPCWMQIDFPSRRDLVAVSGRAQV